MVDWVFYQYPTRLLFTVAGAKPLRRLQSTFLGPRIFMGSLALAGALGAIAPMMRKKRAFILTDKPIRKLAESLVPIFQNYGFEVEICDKAEPEPPLDVVDDIANDMTRFEPDLIVAVGGGSAIDAAKAAWIKYEKPEINIGQTFPLQPIGLRSKAFLMAIPTTAGTGSEATWAIVLTDTKEDPPRKIAHGHPELVPDFAVLIPELTVGMPRDLTIGTGLDVIAHAFEAVMCRQWTNAICENLAIGAIKTVVKYLPIAAEDPHNLEARYNMLVAATMAGLAFSNSGSALTHSLGHALGKVYNVHHGLAVGIFVPYILGYVSKVTNCYVEVAKALDIRAESDEEYLQKLLNFIIEFYKKLGVSIALKDLGIDRKDFEEKLDVLVKYAYEDPTIVFTVRPTNEAEIRRIFEYAYDGKLVDW